MAIKTVERVTSIPDIPYPVVANANFMQRLRVRLTGRAFLFLDSKNFKKPTPIYLFHCRTHKLWSEDYLHGNGRWNCIRCTQSRKTIDALDTSNA